MPPLSLILILIPRNPCFVPISQVFQTVGIEDLSRKDCLAKEEAKFYFSFAAIMYHAE